MFALVFCRGLAHGAKDHVSCVPSTALKLHGPSLHGDGCTNSTISARLFARADAENMQLVVMTVSGSFVDQRLRKPLLEFGVQNSNMAKT